MYVNDLSNINSGHKTKCNLNKKYNTLLITKQLVNNNLINKHTLDLLFYRLLTFYNNILFFLDVMLYLPLYTRH